MHAPPTLSVYRRAADGAVVAGVGLLAAGRAPTVESLAFVGFLTVAVLAVWPRRSHLAWLAGLLFCINELDGVPTLVPQAVNVVLVFLVALRYRPGLAQASRRTVIWLLVMLTAMVTLIGLFGVARDPLIPTLRFTGLYAVSVVAAGMIAFRVSAYRPLLMGFVAGAATSSAVAIGQALGIDLLRTAAHGDGRYPGLALEAPGVAWHTAAAIPVAIFAIASASSAKARAWSWAGLTLCAGGMAVCGAQGGILGLAAAALVCLVLAWRQVNRPALAKLISVAVIVLGAAVAASLLAGLDPSSLTGMSKEASRDYENEVARLRAARYGLEQFLEAPLTGIGTTAYDDRYDVRPHVLPLNLSVNTGVLGFAVGIGLVGLLGWTALRGPLDRRSPQGWLGVAMIVTMFTHAMLTPSGPFARIDRISLLLIAVVLARGGAPALDGSAQHREPGHDGALSVGEAS